MSEQKIDYRRYDCTKARLETMNLNDLIDELHRLEDIEDNRDELIDALERLLVFAEDVEVKALVGDEGCLWPAEIARAALKTAKGESS